MKRAGSLDRSNEIKRIRRSYRKIEAAGDGEIVVTASTGARHSLRVPVDRTLDDPQGLVLDAADACRKHIAPIPGFAEEFSKHFVASPRGDCEDPFSRNLKLYSRTTTLDLDNPGHMLLALRGVTGSDVALAHTAYLRAMRSKRADSPDGLVFEHAKVCKAIGSAYFATPIPRAACPTVDPILILLDAVLAACPEIMTYPPMSFTDERPGFLRALRAWSCPAYVRSRFPVESEKWGFDRPRERAEAITVSLNALGYGKKINI